MSLDSYAYRKGIFPKSAVHPLVVSQVRRLRPEKPVAFIDKLGDMIARFHQRIGVSFAIPCALGVLTFLTVGLALPLFIIAGIAQLRWGQRGNPNSPDRMVINSNDLERLMAGTPSIESVAVYTDALHAVMGASLDEDEYIELTAMLKSLLQSEREAHQRRMESEVVLARLSGHDPIRAHQQGLADLEGTSNEATKQVLEKYLSVVENQKERRELLRTQIHQLQAQELLAIELMRSVGESALQLDTIPYVAITPILNNARDLVYQMDHQVLAFERAVVEMEVEPYRLNLATQN